MKTQQEYMSLVQHFPMLPITNREQNEKALGVIAKLMEKENVLSPQARGYLEVLTALVKSYEDSVVQPAPNMTPQQTLTYLLEANGLSQMDLCRELGIHKSHLSGFLTGRRALSKQEIGLLAKRFHINPLVFAADGFFGTALRKREFIRYHPSALPAMYVAERNQP
jgi:antitoxin component HigA of HigAB toxin-antitoxin module